MKNAFRKLLFNLEYYLNIENKMESFVALNTLSTSVSECLRDVE